MPSRPVNGSRHAPVRYRPDHRTDWPCEACGHHGSAHFRASGFCAADGRCPCPGWRSEPAAEEHIRTLESRLAAVAALLPDVDGEQVVMRRLWQLTLMSARPRRREDILAAARIAALPVTPREIPIDDDSSPL